MANLRSIRWPPEKEEGKDVVDIWIVGNGEHGMRQETTKDVPLKRLKKL